MEALNISTSGFGHLELPRKPAGTLDEILEIQTDAGNTKNNLFDQGGQGDQFIENTGLGGEGR